MHRAAAFRACLSVYPFGPQGNTYRAGGRIRLREGVWQGMNDELEQKEINYVRGKTAGNDVIDRNGNMLVRKGDSIDDDMINRAMREGLIHALMLSAASAVIEAGGDEARRRLQEFRDITENHEADLVLNGVAAWDVKDLRGNVLVNAGQTVTPDIVRRATEASMLQDLVLAVAAPGKLVSMEPPQRQRFASEMGYAPYPSGQQPTP